MLTRNHANSMDRSYEPSKNECLIQGKRAIFREGGHRASESKWAESFASIRSAAGTFWRAGACRAQRVIRGSSIDPDAGRGGGIRPHPAPKQVGTLWERVETRKNQELPIKKLKGAVSTLVELLRLLGAFTAGKIGDIHFTAIHTDHAFPEHLKCMHWSAAA